MTDFRMIERELIEFFDAAGVDIVQHHGDHFAVVVPIPDCGKPRACDAVCTDRGLQCFTCDDPDEGARAATISLTKLAERLAGK